MGTNLVRPSEWLPADGRRVIVPPGRHRHSIPGRGGMFPRVGTIGICDCGTPIWWNGSPGGMVSWWPLSRWERWRHRSALAALANDEQAGRS